LRGGWSGGFVQHAPEKKRVRVGRMLATGVPSPRFFRRDFGVLRIETVDIFLGLEVCPRLGPESLDIFLGLELCPAASGPAFGRSGQTLGRISGAGSVSGHLKAGLVTFGSNPWTHFWNWKCVRPSPSPGLGHSSRGGSVSARPSTRPRSAPPARPWAHPARSRPRGASCGPGCRGSRLDPVPGRASLVATALSSAS